MSVLPHFPGPLEYQVSSLRTSGLEMGHPLVWSSILDQLDGQGWSKREGLVQGGGRTLFAASLPHHISGNNGDPSPLSPPIEEGPPPTSPQPVDQKPPSLPSFCPLSLHQARMRWSQQILSRLGGTRITDCRLIITYLYFTGSLPPLLIWIFLGSKSQMLGDG